VITTALVPGRKSDPGHRTLRWVQMKPGSVIADLAAEQGQTAPVLNQVKTVALLLSTN